ncbi:MAG TPA: hypothetical protein PKC49_06490 [Phycisphaerae bacterium]|nr:hypothetical protein [Phycisphaerae bacterium]
MGSHGSASARLPPGCGVRHRRQALRATVGLDYSNVTNFLGLASVRGGAENQAGNIITRLLADDITPDSGGTGVTQMKSPRVDASPAPSNV